MKFSRVEHEYLLKVDESEFPLIAEAIPHIVWKAAPDGSTQYVNHRATDYAGISRGTNSDWNWVLLAHQEDADHGRRAWEHARRTGTKCELECRIRRADGQFRWHALCSIPLRGSDGQVLKWIGTATDIDDQKQLETELRFLQRQSAESTAFIETLHAHSPVGLGFVDRDFRIVHMNTALAAFNGAPLEEQIGRTVAELVPDLWPQIENIYRSVLDTRKPVLNVEVVGKVASKPGELGCWLASYHAVILDDVAIGIGLVVVDITDRKRAEQSRHAAEEQFKSLADQSITGMYIIQEGKFSYVNTRFAEIFGYASPADMVGLDATHVVASKDRERVAKNLRDKSEGMVKRLDCCFSGLRKDGTTTEVGVHGTVASYLGQPAVVGLLQDISEKKRAEDEIRCYIQQLESAFMRTVEVAMTLSGMRDAYTTGHERRVAEIAVAIGTELGFDAHRAQGLRVAGYLHDIGKIIVPAEILAKPTRLTPAEYELIKGHAKASFDVLKNVEFPWPVAQVALQHHERLDGSGYPQGLRGEDILLEARIMAVADVVEAMASHRPYRPGLGIEKALAEIERGRGAIYDPTVVDACLKLFREKHYAIPG
jgi:PAS domain S-box-containing protein